jgi:pSer/pThr/pTyr-binding forkhead associated (FHA) protein
MSFRLVPLSKGTAPIIALHRPVLLIGRHLDCDVRIDLSKISRRHCCLAIAYDRVLVRDLGSRNQVRVNGQVVQEARLMSGDELAIGPILYRLELQPDESRAPAPPSAHPASVSPGVRGKTPPSPLPVPAGKASASAEDSDEDLVPLDL